MKKLTYSACFLLLFGLSGLSNCKKETFERTNSSTAEIVKCTVSGQVLDENGQPVVNATVSMNGETTTSNEYGAFIFKNIKTPSDRAILNVSATDFFDGSRTLAVRKGGFYSIKIRMLARIFASNFSSANGGQVEFSNKLQLVFPKDAIVKNGAAFNGNVRVAIGLIDAQDPNLPELMPGALRGIDASDIEKLLFTQGMFQVELTDDSGQKLEIAPGKQVEFSLKAQNSPNLPATIPMWHFDETEGLWKEEGAAILQSGLYVGAVGHFSWWNLDVPTTMVRVKFRLVDRAKGEPLIMKEVGFYSPTLGHGYGYSDHKGEFDDFVPANEVLGVSILTSGYCSIPVNFDLKIGPFSSDPEIGDVEIDLQADVPDTKHISGRLVDCDGKPVAFGAFGIFADADGLLQMVPADGEGRFEYLGEKCSPSLYSYFTIDYSTGNKSRLHNLDSLATISNYFDLGDINTCEVKASFINLTFDGKKHQLEVNLFWDNYKEISGFTQGADSLSFNMSFKNAPGFNMPGIYKLDKFQFGTFSTENPNDIDIEHEITKWETFVLMFGKFDGSMRDSSGIEHAVKGNYEIYAQ